LIHIRRITTAASLVALLCSASPLAGAGTAHGPSGRAAHQARLRAANPEDRSGRLVGPDGPAGLARARRWDGRRPDLARDERALGLLSGAGHRSPAGLAWAPGAPSRPYGPPRAAASAGRVNDPAFDQVFTAQSESRVATNGRSVVVAFNDTGSYLPWDESTANFSAYATSADGGRTFAHGRVPQPAGWVNLGEGAVAAGPNGEYYLAGLAWREFVPTIGVAKSTDDGLTFSNPVDVDPPFADPDNIHEHPSIAVDAWPTSPNRGAVYVSWTRFFAEIDAPQSIIYVARSTDGGASFGDPVAVSPLDRTDYVQGSVLAVAPDGTVVVAYYDQHPTGDGTVAVSTAKSVDGGKTFSAPAAAARFFRAARQLNGHDPQRVNSLPALAADALGRVHLVYAASEPGDPSSVFYARSVDGGATFGEPVRLNDDGTTTAQAYPSVAVTASGRVGVRWADRRSDPAHDVMSDVFMAISPDGGAAWHPNFRISDHAWAPGLVELANAPGYHGDFDGVAALGERFVATWSDERDDTQDVYATVVEASRPASVPDFSVRVDAPWKAAEAGHAIDFTVTVDARAGFSGEVALSAHTGDADVDAAPRRSTVLPGESAAIAVTPEAGAESKVTRVTVEARSGALTHKLSVHVRVYAAGALTELPRSLSEGAGGGRGAHPTPVFSDVDSDGVVHTVTTELDSTGREVVLHRESSDGGVSFGEGRVVVYPDAYEPGAYPAAMQVTPKGTVVVVLRVAVPEVFGAFRHFVTRSTRDGFGDPVEVTGPDTFALPTPRLAVGPRGRVALAYTGYVLIDSELIPFNLLHVSGDNGKTFSTAKRMTKQRDGYEGIGEADVAYDSRGRLVLVTRLNAYDFDLGQYRTTLRARTAADGRAFGKFVEVTSSLWPDESGEHYPYDAAIAFDDEDTLHVVYPTFTYDFASNVQRLDLVARRSANRGRTFTDAVHISGDELVHASATSWAPQIHTRGGAVFVAFGATRNSSVFMQPFPRVAKAGVNLVVSSNRGATWRPVVEISGRFGWAAGFSGGVLPDGTAVLTFDDRSPGYYDRFLVRVR
jgi:hypothetical protein